MKWYDWVVLFLVFFWVMGAVLPPHQGNIDECLGEAARDHACASK